MVNTLEADGIRLQFGNRVILSDIYLKVQTGSICGILGRNGEGKSCLLQIIFGSMACEKSVRINSKSYNQSIAYNQQIKYLPQFNFVPKGLGLGQVLFDYGLCFQSLKAHFPEFKHNKSIKIGQLSGGQQRLIEVFIIVSSAFSFALLDEPFTHLSPLQIEQMLIFLKHEKLTKGIIITDHLYQHVLQVSNPLFVLVNGKLHLIKNENQLNSLGYLTP